MQIPDLFIQKGSLDTKLAGGFGFISIVVGDGFLDQPAFQCFDLSPVAPLIGADGSAVVILLQIFW